MAENLAALQEEWNRVVARAWTDSKFMDDLRKNPRETLMREDVRKHLELHALSEDFLPIPGKEQALDLPQGALEKDIIDYLRDDKHGETLFGAMRMSCI